MTDMATLALKGSSILVLGMHRSGTSSLTRILNLHGVNLGSRLLEAAADNEAGFWENYYAVDLNERALAALGYTWDDLRLLPTGWCSSQTLVSIRQELQEIIEREFAPSPLWAVKDPRLCRLAPLWYAAVEECNYVPKRLIAVRHPEEVVQSLIKRNGMPSASATLLWLRHLSESLALGNVSDCVLITYDQLLLDWRECMSRISAGLNIEWPIASAICAADVDAHLDPGLRHNVKGQSPTVLPAPWRMLLLDVYASCQAIAEGRGHISDLAGLLTDMDARFAFIEPLSSDIVPNSKFEALRRAMDGGGLYAPNSESSLARSTVSDAVQKFDADRVSAFALAEKLRSAREQLSEQEIAKNAARESFDILMDRYDRTVLSLNDVQAEKEAVEAEYREALEALAALKEGRETERIAIEELKMAIQERDGVVAQLRQELATSVSGEEFRGMLIQRDSLHRKLVLAEENLQSMAERSHSVSVELNQIKASLSWRAASSLRRVARQNAWIGRVVHVARRLAGLARSPRTASPPDTHAKISNSIDLTVANELEQLSALFVAEWYLSNNDDVRASQADPFDHFIRYGLAEGRSPSPLLDLAFYLDTNEDVREAKINPLLHYLHHGGVEGRSPHPLFDARWYLKKNPDVRDAGINPLLHFVKFGAREGRSPNMLFDVNWYRHEYLRYAREDVNPLVHYVLHGSTIRLQPCLLFNAKRYASDNDLAPSDDALAHYLLLARSHEEDPLEALRLRMQWSQREALGLAGPKASSRKIVVGIVTYNNDHVELTRCVRSADRALFEYDGSGGEIYIIDNGAVSDSVPGIGAEVVHFPTKGNVGFGAAHNVLMAKAFEQGADVYIAANPDGVFDPGCVSALLAMSAASHGRALIEALQFPEEHPKTYDLWSFDTPWASGACLLITKEIYQVIGGFADEFFMYCEDVDISWRARREGFLVKTCPRARFFHPVTDRGFDLEIQRRFLTSGLILARKWRSSSFEQTILAQFEEYGLKVPEIGPVKIVDAPVSVADFNHSFSFASTRW